MSEEDKENLEPFSAPRSGDGLSDTLVDLSSFQAPFSLPGDWKVGLSQELKRYYYFNPVREKVCWIPPVKAWLCSFGLPFGWEIGLDKNENPYYIGHVTETTTYRHPRLDAGEGEVLQQAIQTKRRKIAIRRDRVNGFGFVAGSEKPVLIRSVMPGSPSEGLLSANDQIFSINGQIAYNLPQPQVISMIRSCTDVLELDVIATEDIQDVKNQGKLKSALMSRATRERRKSCPVNVRFDDKPEVVDITPYNVLNVNMIRQMLPNVLKVFLENGQTKSFQYTSDTTIKDIFDSLEEKLQLKSPDIFALVLIGPYPNQISYLHLEDRIEQVLSRKHFSRWECRLQICFAPRRAYDLLQSDPFAFDYLYEQIKNSVTNGHFGAELKYDVALRLAALQMNEECSRATGDEERKLTLKEIQKEHGGLEKFLPRGITYSARKKDLKKSLSYHLKLCERLTAPGQKHINSIQAKLHYLKIASEAPTFGGKSFNAVVMQDGETLVAFREKHVDHSTVSVSAVQGIGIAVPGTSMATSQLADFLDVTAMVITSPTIGKDHLKLFLKDKKPISFVMEPQDGEDLAFLVAGYHANLADDKVEPIRTLNFSQSLPRFPSSEVESEAPTYSSEHHVLPSSWSYPEEQFNELWTFSSLQQGERKLHDITLPMNFVNTAPSIGDAKAVENKAPKVLRRRTASDFGLTNDNDKKKFRISDQFATPERSGSLPSRGHPRPIKSMSLPDMGNGNEIPFTEKEVAIDESPLAEEDPLPPLPVSPPFAGQKNNFKRFIVDTEEDSDADEPMFRGTRLFSGGSSDLPRRSSLSNRGSGGIVLSSFLPENKADEDVIADGESTVPMAGAKKKDVKLDAKAVEAAVKTQTEIPKSDAFGSDEALDLEDALDANSVEVELITDSGKDRGTKNQDQVYSADNRRASLDAGTETAETAEPKDAVSRDDAASQAIDKGKINIKTNAVTSEKSEPQVELVTEDPFKGIDPFEGLGKTRQLSIDMKTFDNRGIKTKLWESESEDSLSPQNTCKVTEIFRAAIVERSSSKHKRSQAIPSVPEETSDTFEVYLSKSNLRRTSSSASFNEEDGNIFNDPTARSLPRNIKASALGALYDYEVCPGIEAEIAPASEDRVERATDCENISEKLHSVGFDKVKNASKRFDDDQESSLESGSISPPMERVASPEMFILPPPPLDFSVDRLSPTSFIVPPPPDTSLDDEDNAEDPILQNRFPNLCAVDDLDLIRRRSAPSPPARSQSLKSRLEGTVEIDSGLLSAEIEDSLAEGDSVANPNNPSENDVRATKGSWDVNVEGKMRYDDVGNKILTHEGSTDDETSVMDSALSSLKKGKRDHSVAALLDPANVSVSDEDLELEEYVLDGNNSIDLEFEEELDNMEAPVRQQPLTESFEALEKSISGEIDVEMRANGVLNMLDQIGSFDSELASSSVERKGSRLFLERSQLDVNLDVDPDFDSDLDANAEGTANVNDSVNGDMGIEVNNNLGQLEFYPKAKVNDSGLRENSDKRAACTESTELPHLDGMQSIEPKYSVFVGSPVVESNEKIRKIPSSKRELAGKESGKTVEHGVTDKKEKRECTRKLSILDISAIDDSEATFFFGEDDPQPVKEVTPLTPSQPLHGKGNPHIIDNEDKLEVERDNYIASVSILDDTSNGTVTLPAVNSPVLQGPVEDIQLEWTEASTERGTSMTHKGSSEAGVQDQEDLSVRMTESSRFEQQIPDLASLSCTEDKAGETRLMNKTLDGSSLEVGEISLSEERTVSSLEKVPLIYTNETLSYSSDLLDNNLSSEAAEERNLFIASETAARRDAAETDAGLKERYLPSVRQPHSVKSSGDEILNSSKGQIKMSLTESLEIRPQISSEENPRLTNGTGHILAREVAQFVPEGSEFALRNDESILDGNQRITLDACSVSDSTGNPENGRVRSFDENEKHTGKDPKLQDIDFNMKDTPFFYSSSTANVPSTDLIGTGSSLSVGRSVMLNDERANVKFINDQASSLTPSLQDQCLDSSAIHTQLDDKSGEITVSFDRSLIASPEADPSSSKYDNWDFEGEVKLDREVDRNGENELAVLPLENAVVERGDDSTASLFFTDPKEQGIVDSFQPLAYNGIAAKLSNGGVFSDPVFGSMSFFPASTKHDEGQSDKTLSVAGSGGLKYRSAGPAPLVLNTRSTDNYSEKDPKLNKETEYRVPPMYTSQEPSSSSEGSKGTFETNTPIEKTLGVDLVDENWSPSNGTKARLSPISLMNTRMGSFKSFFFQGTPEGKESIHHSRTGSLPINAPIPFHTRGTPSRVQFKPGESLAMAKVQPASPVKQAESGPLTLPTVPHNAVLSDGKISITSRSSGDSDVKAVTSQKEVKTIRTEEMELKTASSEPQQDVKVTKDQVVRERQSSFPVISTVTGRNVTQKTVLSVKVSEGAPVIRKLAGDDRNTYVNTGLLRPKDAVSANSTLTQVKPSETSSVVSRGNHIEHGDHFFTHSGVPEEQFGTYPVSEGRVQKAASLPRMSRANTTTGRVVLVSQTSPSKEITSTRVHVSRGSASFSSSHSSSLHFTTGATRSLRDNYPERISRSDSLERACYSARLKATSLRTQLMHELRMDQPIEKNDRLNKAALLDSVRAWARSFSKIARNGVSSITDGEESDARAFVQASLDRLNNLVIATVVFSEAAIANGVGHLRREAWHDLLRELIKSVLIVVDEYVAMLDCIEISLGKPINDPSIANMVEQADQLGFAVTIVIRSIRSIASEVIQ